MIKYELPAFKIEVTLIKINEYFFQKNKFFYYFIALQFLWSMAESLVIRLKAPKNPRYVKNFLDFRFISDFLKILLGLGE